MRAEDRGDLRRRGQATGPASAGPGAGRVANGGPEATALLARLRALDVRLWVDAGALRYSAPAGALSAELLAELRRRKAELLVILDEGSLGPGSSEPIVPVAEGSRVASFAQERLWFLEAMGAGGPAYHLPLHQRWRGPLDRAALARALAALVDRHQALRTGFRAAGSRPIPVVAPPGSLPLAVIDLRHLPAAAREAEARRLSAAETRRPFDLGLPPLFRATLIVLGDDDHALLQTTHHIVADGWSLGILVRELAELYDAFAAGKPDPLPPLAVQHADVAAWERRRLGGEALDASLAYWTRQLGGLPPLDLLADDLDDTTGPTGGGVPIRVPAAVVGPFRRLAQGQGATLYMALLAAFQALLARYTGQPRIAVAGPVAHRDRPETAGVVGPFANLLVFATDVTGDPGFTVLLHRVRDVTVAAQAHGEVPFERVVEAVQPDRDLRRHPLVQASFTLQPLSGIVPRPRTPGLAVTLLPGEAPAVRLDLELHAWEDGDGLGGVLLYRADRFAARRVERMARHLEALLAAVAGSPDRPIGALPILDGGERAALLDRGRATAGHPVAGGLHDLVAAQAAARPDAVAVTGPAEGQIEPEGGATATVTLTYDALDRRANRLAHRLRRLGLGPERRVAIGLGRSVELAVAMLAVLKAGGAYLPLDPDYPAERLAYLVGDAAPVALLTNRARGAALARAAAFDGPVVHVDDPTLAAEPSTRPAVAVDPAGLAYVIYTSGSTGRPKGVAMPHAQVARLFAATRPWFGFGPTTTWSLFHSPAFDFSVWELWGPLTSGGRVAVAPYWVTRSPRDFHAWLGREGVTLLSQTPSAFRQLQVAAAGGGGGPTPLQHVAFGGEALDFASLAPWVAHHGDRAPRLVNMYGITETTVHVTYREVTREDVARGGNAIGRAIPDLDLLLLDPRGEPVPDGVTGELHVGGAGVARGYLGRPALTAERFVPHPFRSGARLYRSGDLARYRVRDGAGPGEVDLTYGGRGDSQVKIRGFRIEPAEVEAALREQPGVADAVVTYRDDGPRGPRLVAHVVLAAGATLTGEGLRRELAGRLPEHLVPGRVVTVAALPLTAHGKLDRAALPPDDDLPAGPGDGAAAEMPDAPESPDEEILAGIFGRLLGQGRLSRQASFFELGGHSLLAMQLVGEVCQAFGVELPVRRVFESPSLAALAAAIVALRRAPETAPPPLVGPGATPPASGDGDGEPAVLSFAQARLWVLHQLEPDSAAYHVPAAYRLRGPLDRPALVSALRHVVGRHAILRAVIDAGSGAPVARAGDPDRLAMPVIDLAALPAPARWAAASRLAAEESQRPFRLHREWPLRAQLLALGPAEHVLLLTLHHIAADGWSLGILLGELGQAYESLARGQVPAPSPLAVSHAGYAAWQRRWLGPDQEAGPLAYWRDALRDLPALELPLDAPRAGAADDAAGFESFELSPELTAGLQALAREQHATLFMALLAGFAALLSRHGGGPDVAIGSPVASRSRPELAGVIGPFVNMLVFRADLQGDPTVRELLGRVRRTVLDGVTHQDVPFERIVEALRPERDLHRHPLFQVSLTLQPPGAVAPPLRLLAVEAEPLDTGFRRMRFDLELHAWETGGRLAGSLLYRRALFRPATAAALVRRLTRLLAAAVAGPDTPLSALPLVDAGERRRLVARGARRASRPGPREGLTLHELFARQAALRPEAPAVTGAADAGPSAEPGPAPLSYGELEAQSNRVAHHLRALGAGPEARIALLVERAPALVVGLLGILKAGAAYVPLDPTHPPSRLAYLLGDARPLAVVTDGGLRPRLPAFDGPVVDLDRDADAIAARPAHAPASRAGPDSLAYVIYTSGSTGQPKGVLVTHRNVTRLFDATDGELGFHAGMAWSLFHSIAFDFSVWELWGALLHGGRVVIVPYWVSRSPSDVLALLRREGVTVLSQTPSAFRTLAAADAGGPLALTHVVFGGEALDFRALRGWCERHGDEAPRLINMYGITETTVHVTWRRVRREDVDDPRSLIGDPLPDLDLHVIDERGEPTPPGVPGELHVGGAGLARGYLGREALTRERFVPHPFRPGERIYKSGDRARLVAGRDGREDVEYLGRLDDQVQLRGFRVEPGEVEAALRTHPAVRDAVVLALDDGPRGPRLAVYAVTGGPGGGPGGGPAPEPAALRAHLAGLLPDHMVPAGVAVLAALPLTANGKLDRGKLRALEAGPGEAGPGRGPDALPGGPDAALLSAIWEGLLGAPPAGAEASFFEAGGHSLLAAQLVSRLRDAFGVEVPLRRVFEHPTVAALLAAIREARGVGETGTNAPPIAPAAPGERGLLSFAQERLWFLDQLEAGAPTFNVPLALRLRGPLRPSVVRRSLAALVERHQVLRTRVVRDGDAPRAVLGEPAVPLPMIDLEGLPREPAALAEAAARAEAAALRQEAGRPFDLAREIPLRAVLLRHDERHHVLALTLHHVAADAWSLPILRREWAALHAALAAAGQPADAGLPPLALQYADVAAWQRRHLTGEALAPDLDYWRRRLAGAPERLGLPTDRPRPPVAGAAGRLAPFRVEPEMARALRAVGAETGATPFMVLCAAYAAFLHRQTGQTDLVVGTPVAGRERTEAEPLIGCFVNTLCLRLDLAGRPSFREVVRRVRRAVLDAYDHQRLPFERLVAALQPERRLGQAPLVQTMFDLAPADTIAPPAVAALDQARALDETPGSNGPGLAMSPVASPVETAKFDLGLSMSEAGGTFVGCWEYRTDLFTSETAARWTSQLLALLGAAAARPGEPVAALPLEPAAEAERRAAASGEPLEPTGVASLSEALADGAAASPDAVAVVAEPADGGGQGTAHLTHEALHRRAGHLARRLRSEHGVGPESVVAILVPRSPEWVTALLGVMVAGAAYLPLDPDHPDERLRAMRRAAGARVLVTLERQAARVAEPGVAVVALDGARAGLAEPAGPAGAPGSGRPPVAHPDSAVAVLFTSGSTGSPKGVVITHRGLAAFTRAATRRYGIGAADRVLQFASPAFDTAGEELYPVLASGGTVVLRIDDATTSTRALLDQAWRQAVTVVDLPTAYWHELVADLGPGPAALPPAVRLAIIGGERARPEAVAAWRSAVGPTPRLLNTYGPTEATVVATSSDLSRPGLPSLAEVPIGRPLPGATALVLEAQDGVAAPGVPGELRLGGPGLARGYAGRPAETALRFTPHPYGRGARLYRTGDRARVLADGELQYLGRLDAQLKVRGHRVEPEEVEAALLAQPGVREAAVAWREEGDGEGRLVAYVTAAGGADRGVAIPAPEPAALREAIRRRLPEALVPAAIVLLPRLPRTPGGKVDRRALPAPDRTAAGPVPYVPPGSSDEALLAGLWAEVLGLERVGLDDSFFDLGGHSLGLLALQRRLRERLGREVPVVDLFRFPTVRTLAAHLRQGAEAIDPAIPRAQAAAESQRAALARLSRRHRAGPGPA